MMNDKYATTDISEYINGYSDTKYWWDENWSTYKNVEKISKQMI